MQIKPKHQTINTTVYKSSLYSKSFAEYEYQLTNQQKPQDTSYTIYIHKNVFYSFFGKHLLTLKPLINNNNKIINIYNIWALNDIKFFSLIG